MQWLETRAQRRPSSGRPPPRAGQRPNSPRRASCTSAGRSCTMSHDDTKTLDVTTDDGGIDHYQ
eukprot:11167060-Lingulodinium_polyedra.AAC.1